MISNFFPLSRFFWLLELIDSKRNKISQRFQFQLISKSTQLENLFDSNKEKTKLGIGKFEISVIFHELHNHYKKSHSFPEIVEIPCGSAIMEQPKIQWELEVAGFCQSVVIGISSPKLTLCWAGNNYNLVFLTDTYPGPVGFLAGLWRVPADT